MSHTIMDQLVTEVPSSLKQLARLVVRGFYCIEDALIVDMLVRNPCMKEDDICELLKFERKMLRARITTLKSDKFIQVRLKMETGTDGKAQKVNYYFINYKSFVNVVKYKLDLMHKRLETEERDATSRASFRCPGCCKTFTDLEADQLFDFTTQEFRCTFCKEVVEEDQSALPKKDSRLMLAKFNEQMEPLYILLKEVEGIKLAPEVLEPEPTDLSFIRGLDGQKGAVRPSGDTSGAWSGEATRGHGFQEMDVESSTVEQTMTERTKGQDDIMSVLLANEKKGGAGSSSAKAVIPGQQDSASDTSDDEVEIIPKETAPSPDVEIMDSDDEELTPTVSVGGRNVAITDVNDQLIAQMTPEEKESYIHIYQEYYAHMYD
ncbi:hypothetical protein B566_EDAN003847 [Ephemera danica]|nr:hypothetical protein B566_EDAN003847 [Ephemera danica]